MSTTSPNIKENNAKDHLWYEPIENPKAGGVRYATVPIQFLLDRRVTSNLSKLMFVALCQYANNKTGLVGKFDVATKQYNTPSVRTLSRLVGVSYSNASTAMQQLIDTGWITVKRRQNKSSIIHVRIPSEIDVYDETREKFHYQEDLLSNEDYSLQQSEIKARNKVDAAKRLAKRAESKAIKKETADSFDDSIFDDVSDEPFDNSEAFEKLAAKRVEAVSVATTTAVSRNSVLPETCKNLESAVIDIATFIATGNKKYGNFAVGLYGLSYDMTAEELTSECPIYADLIDEIIG